MNNFEKFKGKNKIALMICYYGEFPRWFNYWLLSCEKNPNFDFYIITDLYYEKLPSNVFIVNESFSDLKDRFEKTLNMNISLTRYYKLCDYKPLYGLAFKNELKNYEFWGHCDMDTIWGDMSKYINDDVLKSYDVIGRLGHFRLYRNNEFINNLFRQSGAPFSYNTVFSREENYWFDETPGMNRIIKHNNINMFDLPVADIQKYRNITIYWTKHCSDYFFWNNGHCYRCYKLEEKLITEEYAYFHFSGRKPIVKDTVFSNFYFTRDGFKERKYNLPSIEEFIEHAQEYSNFRDKYETISIAVGKIYDRLFKMSFREKYIYFKNHFL